MEEDIEEKVKKTETELDNVSHAARSVISAQVLSSIILGFASDIGEHALFVALSQVLSALTEEEVGRVIVAANMARSLYGDRFERDIETQEH